MGFIVESLATELLIALVTFLAVAYYQFTDVYSYWKKKGVPYIKPKLFFGNFKGMIMLKQSMNDSFDDLYNSKELKGKPYGGAWFARKPMFLVFDPDIIKDILIKDFVYFTDRGLDYNEKKEHLSAHLFNLGGWRWKALRTRMTPAFTSGKMKVMFDTMAGCATRLEKLLEAPAKAGKIIEMKETATRYTTDVIGTCVFGLELNSMESEESEFLTMGKAIFVRDFWKVLKVFLSHLFPVLIKYLNLNLISPKISKFFTAIVHETIEHREKNNVSRNDMMQQLIDIKKQGPIVDDEGKYDTAHHEIEKDELGRQVLNPDNNVIAAQACVFFFAGLETSSTAMSFALYELARNPEIQDRLAEEIRTDLDKNGGNVSYEIIQNMKYLDMVVSETLRKYPPVPTVLRRVTRDYKMNPDLVLDKGTKVFVPVYSIHNDPQYYPDPHKFDPERFSTKSTTRHPMVYMPFGEGPRSCIGARFGLLQTKIGLVTVLRRYKVEVCELTPIPPTFDPVSLSMSLKGNYHFRISIRN